MAAKRANEPRVLIRVPTSFRDKLNDAASVAGIPATDYLETVSFAGQAIIRS
jgi:hypothetical protein